MATEIQVNLPHNPWYWHYVLIIGGVAGIILSNWIPFWVCAVVYISISFGLTQYMETKRQDALAIYHTMVLVEFAQALGAEVKANDEGEV